MQLTTAESDRQADIAFLYLDWVNEFTRNKNGNLCMKWGRGVLTVFTRPQDGLYTYCIKKAITNIRYGDNYRTEDEALRALYREVVKA